MRKIIFIFICLAIAATYSRAQATKTIVTVSNGDLGDVSTTKVSMVRKGNKLQVDIELDLSKLEVKSKEAVLITPVLSAGSRSETLPSVGIYGNRRYWYYLRNDSFPSGQQTIIRAKEMKSSYSYSTSVPWEEWMNGTGLLLTRKSYGCCGTKLSDDSCGLAGSEEYVFVPEFRYVHPTAEGSKQHSLSGSALITFPVNQTVIKAEYKNNAAELEKIASTIKGVSSDADYTINSLTLKGYASPEGSYTSNARLAEGRTDALRDYIVASYGVQRSIISTSSEPENWEGLREYVAGSGLQHKNEILEIIDSDDFADLDKKEWRIKNRYPRDYATLLSECYPSLRRTDYKVDYTIRSYTDVDEIRALVKTAPGKLSLEEFYLAAMGLDSGSEEFREIFDVAVRMYPDDEAANINAANAAMERGDLVQAAQFLAKAGESSDAAYAREVYAALSGDIAAADRLGGWQKKTR